MMKKTKMLKEEKENEEEIRVTMIMCILGPRA